jgi:endo-1,4-beta-D-glucanase Y
MKSPFVDMYDRTRIMAHRHDRKRGRKDGFDPSDILGFTPEEMEMTEAGLFEDEMEQKGDVVATGTSTEGDVALSVTATEAATEATKPEEVQVSEAVSSSPVVANKQAKASSMMSFVVPEGSTARVLIWDGVSDIIIIRSA